MNALRNLNNSNKLLSKSLERLSTGLKINVGADNPAGLIISENLRAEIRGLNMAIENTGRATDLVATAEGALTEVSDLLRDIRGLVLHAVNDGGNDPGELEADQLQIDNALSSIDRLANATRYGSKNLLDGSQQLRMGTVTATLSAFSDIEIRSVSFGTAQSATIDVIITTTAQRACASIGNTSGAVSLRVTGTKGTQVFDFATSTTATDIADTVNLYTDNLGVFATSDAGGAVRFLSKDYGAEAFLTVALVDGDTADYADADTNSDSSTGLYATGVDMVANVGGSQASGKGNSVTVAGTLFTGNMSFSSTAASDTNAHLGASSTTAVQINVRKTGLTFQLGSHTNPNDQVILGIDSVHTSYLGTAQIDGVTADQNGRLTSVRSGGDNDLLTDANTALNVIDNAIRDVSTLRGYLGAFQRNVLETNERSLGVAVENLIASESTVRDVDFAKETTEFTRTQILVQAGTSVLAQANLQSQSILQLLG